ncbi:MAG TPA: ATP-dependent helicase [Ktedonobacterales bacterium]|nr:ATP-dependent helicase [Ktedonobacterales bacterium]
MRTHTLTSEQLDCINFPGDQLLIRGAPGSGKTTTLLYRALALAERRQSPDETISVFTYNKTLASYVHELVAGITDPPITVTTFHSWAWKQLSHERLTPQRNGKVVSGRERAQILMTAVRRVQAALPGERQQKVLENGLKFWEDEFEWVKGRMIEDLGTYEGVARVGRVDPLRIPARRAVWQVLEEYQRELQQRDSIDYDDFALLLLHHWPSVPEEHQIDHVLIDESQDLHAAQIELLARVTGKTITIVADEGQRIYKRSFTWTQLGEEFLSGGRKTKVLKHTFRPTRQILAFAKSLRLEESLGTLADLPPVDIGEPDRDGPIPVIHTVEGRGADLSRAQYQLAVELLGVLRAQYPDQTIGVFARHWDALNGLAAELDRQGNVAYNMVKERNDDVSSPGVKLTTFHSAKGLEFDQVLLIGVDEGTVPQPPDAHMTPEECDEHLRYERRLLYVAMTRARDALHIVHGPAPSPFLAELDPATYQRQARVAPPVPAYDAADDIPF